MKIAIWGGGDFGLYVYKIAYRKIGEIICFIDNNAPNLKGLPVPVFLPHEYKTNQLADEVWIAVLSFYSVEDIISQIREFGIYKVRIVGLDVWNHRKEFITLNSPDAYLLDIHYKSVICKLEYHVTDKCNLNCVGCSHFAPIYRKVPDSNANVNEFFSDVKQLSLKFANILTFRLMGGEPFLNPQLDKYISIVRQFFPNTYLCVVTNGLLFRKVSDRIWNAIKKHNVFVQISSYSPTLRIQNKLKEFLQAKEICFSFSSGLTQNNDVGRIDEFHKCLTQSCTHDPVLAARYCFGSKCHFLRHGKISKCAVPLLSNDVNKYFNSNYKVVPEDYVDIYSDMAPWDMFARLNSPTPFCGYCLEQPPQRFEWTITQQGQEKIDDYVVV